MSVTRRDFFKVSGSVVAATAAGVIIGPGPDLLQVAEAASGQEDPLFITVRRYEGVPDPGVAAQEVQETFVPLISDIPGFVAYYWADAGGGTMISVSVFEDRTGAEESNLRAADWVRERPGVLPSVTQVTAGDVVARHDK
jgi:hypothetical protein